MAAYAAFFTNMEIEGLGFWAWDMNSGVVSWSRELESIYGYASGTFGGTYDDFRRRVYPDDLAEVERQWNRAVAERRSFHLRFRIVLPRRQVRWVSCRGRAIYDEAGRATCVYGVNVDISERMAMQLEHASLERRLRLSLSVAPVCVSRQDRRLRYTDVINPLIAQSVGEVVGRRDEDLFSADDAGTLSRIKRRVLRTGRGERHEVAVVLGGQRAWFDMTVEAERDDAGRTIGILCASADITERREREELYRSVLQDQTELISRYRPDGTMIFANATYCRFFGKSEREIVGRPWHPQAHPDDIATIEAKLATLSPRQPVVTIENRVRAASGEERWMQFVNRAFFEPDGRIRELQAVGRDITERKRLEAELAAYRSEILRLLQENDELREQQRKEIAREIHDRVGSPLALVRMRLEALLREEAIVPEKRALMRQIEQSLGQAIATTREICSDLRPSALDDIGLVETCRWYLKQWSGQVGIRGALRATAMPKQLPERLRTDLFRALQELLVNVAKHARATRVRVTLRCTGHGLTLRVSDDGGGLGARQASTGLGLVGIRERIARYDGTFEITDHGDGVTACLRVPRVACTS